jgi:hypothetical protein
MADSSPNFIDLVAAAYPEGGDGPREAMDRLWVECFSLPAWLFLMSPRSAETLQPSLQSMDGKGWLLAFTDSDLLHKYARDNKNLDEKGDVLYLSMEPGKALAYLARYEGTEAFGIRFNEHAKRGWFSPLANLPRIHAHLQKQGLFPK